MNAVPFIRFSSPVEARYRGVPAGVRNQLLGGTNEGSVVLRTSEPYLQVLNTCRDKHIVQLQDRGE